MGAYVKTAMLMAAMTAVFMGLGWLIGGQGGMLMALVFAAGMNLFTWWNSDKAVLRSYNAKPIDPVSGPALHRIVADLARRGGLPMPTVYLIPGDQPNAFATGRNPQNAAVAVTEGLLRALPEEEVAGVIAHELAHIRNRDTLIMTVTATFAGAISMLANLAIFMPRERNGQGGGLAALVALIVAPMAAAMVQMAISRTREYEADRIGAEICGEPLWLASALQRIEGFARRVENVQAERNPATAHLFIINPLHAHGRDKLFSTHPATANRVAELRKLADRMGRSGGARRPAAPEMWDRPEAGRAPDMGNVPEAGEAASRIPRSGRTRSPFER